MPATLPSSKLIQIYDSLPPESQRKLVEANLKYILDSAPRRKARRVVCYASRFRKRHSLIPLLDLQGKKKEINGLLADLTRNAKCSLVKDRSNRDELLIEIIDSISAWLSTIWVVVYEHCVHFRLAHQCLLFITDVLERLGDVSRVGGCQCSLKTYEVDIRLKRTNGKTVKHFLFHGPHNIDVVLLWMWRELFVSFSASGGRQARKEIPKMMLDIVEEIGWQSLVRLLKGGISEDDDEEWEDYNNDDDEDNESESELNTGGDRCSCCLHASHWSPQINRQRLYLRGFVHQCLHSIFETAPSQELYIILKELGCNTPVETQRELFDILSQTAGYSSDTFAAALGIYTAENDTQAILHLLDSYSSLLRPRDAPVLQLALLVLSESPLLRTRTLQIIEKEMTDLVCAIRSAIHSNFCRVEDTVHKDELQRILKLSSSSQQRSDRVEQWIDDVITPSSAPLHAVAFAAMMMGIPPPGIEDGEDPDFLGHLDLDPTDPDLEDLREELRPPLGERFDSWIEVANAIKGGTPILSKIYTKATELMPFLRAHDVCEAMQTRISDRPSKRHVSDALNTLSSFAKIQRKRMALRADKKRQKQQQQQSQPASSTQSFRIGAGGFAFDFSSSPPPPPGHASFGGIDDVD
ncbi:hypothetical protein IW261DRAFT_6296 [Armillaria novae-zelandiae]|uniref:Uncharacterized protein n=1 Tax=Armillaria novae-zelandiae TaxID=153914 RepID=A0AA39PTL8_9AGAR|nr:hypothetical protein IW261DRAFT_6296 [Armillaria novae-zelandiae]